VDETLGRRGYDGIVSSDHDLLVRIDERLSTHMLAHTQFVQQYATDRATINARIQRLEDERSERAGSERANARFLTLIITGSSIVTAAAVKLAERLWT
jgi:low affinity Fe/Cu permease